MHLYCLVCCCCSIQYSKPLDTKTEGWTHITPSCTHDQSIHISSGWLLHSRFQIAILFAAIVLYQLQLFKSQRPEPFDSTNRGKKVDYTFLHTCSIHISSKVKLTVTLSNMHYYFAIIMLRLLLMFQSQYPKSFDLKNQGTTHTLDSHLFKVKCTLGVSNMQYCAMHLLCTKQEAEDLRRILHTKNIFNFTTIAQNAKMPKVGQARLHVRRSTHTCNQSQHITQIHII
jgi:hypothetical protein